MYGEKNMKITYIANYIDEKRTLKEVLKNSLYVSTNLLKKLKLTKSIFVNNNVTNVNYIVHVNDIIIVDFDNMDNILNKEKILFKEKFVIKFENMPPILYEDDYLLIVEKPANMPVHPSSYNYENTLSNIVAGYLEKEGVFGIHIVTRIDKNTTGICVFAKHEYIQELFIRKKDSICMKKVYLCIAYGNIEDKHFIIEKNIARKENTIILREVNDYGDYAKTECFLIDNNYNLNYSILKVLLHTGRTHQIRVHMSYIGHPLLGDELYANEIKIKNICNLIERQALHCYNLSFFHPITNKYINIISNVPDDMKKLMTRINKD